jgi:hypothetical protein
MYRAVAEKQGAAAARRGQGPASGLSPCLRVPKVVERAERTVNFEP